MSFRVSVGDALCEWKKSEAEGVEMPHEELCKRLCIDESFFNEYLKLSLQKFEKRAGFVRAGAVAPAAPVAKAKTKASVKSALGKGAAKKPAPTPVAPPAMGGMSTLSKAAQRASGGAGGIPVVAADLGVVPVVPLATQAKPLAAEPSSSGPSKLIESESEEESQEVPLTVMIKERRAKEAAAQKASSKVEDPERSPEDGLDPPTLSANKRGAPVDMKLFLIPVGSLVQGFGDENANPSLLKRRRVDAISGLRLVGEGTVKESEGSVEAGSEDSAEAVFLVGTKLEKWFPHYKEWFTGAVSEIKTSGGELLWHVKYEDGDAEDLSLAQLKNEEVVRVL